MPKALPRERKNLSFRNQVQKVLDDSHPHSPEFHQAVQEIFQDVEEFYLQHPAYAQANVLERLLEPDRILRFRVTWEDDSGGIQVNRGYRVQFHNLLGAYKGGLRFHPSVNESVLKFLAFEQCFKNALTGLPMGGGKGGSDFDPRGKSDREIMRFCQAFMLELSRYIGPEVDVPAGDINVGAREIGYLFGHYVKLKNVWEGALTGKSPSFGGSCGREEATGFGVVYFLEEALKAHDQELEGKRVLISGAGNVALHAAEKCLQEGAQVLSLSDSKGCLHFPEGLSEGDLEKVRRVKREEGGALADLEVGEYLEGSKPWHLEAEIVLPCATQNELDREDAQALVANGLLALAEGANMPLTAKAQDRLLEANRIYVPGKLANAGGVAVSGLERTQNASLTRWDLEKVDRTLREIMSQIHQRASGEVERVDGILPYRKGANLYGFRRLADTLLAFGI